MYRHMYQDFLNTADFEVKVYDASYLVSKIQELCQGCSLNFRFYSYSCINFIIIFPLRTQTALRQFLIVNFYQGNTKNNFDVLARNPYFISIT